MPVPSKRMRKVKRTADNEFSKFTGIPVIKLTGKNSPGCWICAQKRFNNVPVKKVSAAIHDPQTLNYTIKQERREMKEIYVQGTCGIDQCVNPEHTTITRKFVNPWA